MLNRRRFLTNSLAVFTALFGLGCIDSRTAAQELVQELTAAPRYWATSEYLMGWIKDGPNSVPLIAQGSILDPRPSALGQPGTKVLAGSDEVDYGLLQGGRVSIGKWIDPCQLFGMEASGFLMGNTGPRSSFFSPAGDQTSLSVPIQLPDGSETSIYTLVTSPNTPKPMSVYRSSIPLSFGVPKETSFGIKFKLPHGMSMGFWASSI
jgi:hypothetical protein